MTRIGVAKGRGKVVLVQAGNRLCRSLAARIFIVSVGKEPHRQTSADIALLAKLLSVTLKRKNTRAVLRWLASDKAALRRPKACLPAFAPRWSCCLFFGLRLVVQAPSACLKFLLARPTAVSLCGRGIL